MEGDHPVRLTSKRGLKIAIPQSWGTRQHKHEERTSCKFRMFVKRISGPGESQRKDCRPWLSGGIRALRQCPRILGQLAGSTPASKNLSIWRPLQRNQGKTSQGSSYWPSPASTAGTVRNKILKSSDK